MSEDKCEREAPTLESCIEELKRFHEDLKEVREPGDLEFQAARLNTIIGDIATVKIHGSGTGSD